MKKSLIAVALLSGLGCQGNPYSKIDQRMMDKPVVQKPTPVTAGFMCDVPPVMEIAEGAQEILKLNCRVPAGEPIVTFESLPGFAVVDSTNPDTLVISPQVGDAVDPNHPTDLVRKFIVKVNLTSTEVPNAKRTETLLILVRHVARALTVSDFDLGARVMEGANYESFFTVQSADFPNGPFMVSGVDLPPGVMITATNKANRFKVSYKPEYTTVKVGSANNVCYDGMGNLVECNHISWKLKVIDPRGGMYSAQAEWDIVDVRQDPSVVVPKNIIATGGTATFYVQVQDPNGEMIPLLSAVNPPFGTVKIDEAARGANPNPYIMSRVTWSDAPPEAIGTTQSLVLKSCVKDADGGLLQCKETAVSVIFE